MRLRFLLPALFVAFPLAAQMPWTASLPERGVSLDILRPNLQGGDATFLSVAAFASARVPLGNLSVRFELPFARYAEEGLGSSTTLGNPYIGVESYRENGGGFELGIRAPLASEDEIAWLFGSLSDITRLEAFLPNALTVAARGRWRMNNAEGLTADLGGGPSLLIPSEGGDVEMILHHHFSAGYRGETVWAALGFGGLTVVTGEGSLGERMINELGLSVGLSRGNVRPALHLIVPVDDEYSSDVDMVIGVGVSMILR